MCSSILNIRARSLGALLVFFSFVSTTVSAQGNSVTIPAGFDALPGNAAVSMPVRWSDGRMQIIYDHRQLAPLDGQTVTRLRLRRPAFFDEPAYSGPVQRTFEIAIGPAGRTSQSMSDDVDTNLPDAATGTLTTVFGPAPVTVAASPAAAQGDVVGPVIVDIALSQPYTIQVVPGQHLLIDWKCSGAPFDVVDGGWVDAVQMPGAARRGLAAPIGQFGCGGAGTLGDPSSPNRLDVDESDRHPSFGSTTTFVLKNAQSEVQVWLAIALDAVAMTLPAPYGQAITSLPVPTASGCLAWTPLDVFILDAGMTGVGGDLRFDLSLPTTNVFQGMQLDVQALVVENVPQLAFSNGLALWMDDIGLGGQVSTNLTLEDSTDAPWGAQVGLAPIVEFVY